MRYYQVWISTRSNGRAQPLHEHRTGLMGVLDDVAPRGRHGDVLEGVHPLRAGPGEVVVTVWQRNSQGLRGLPHVVCS